MRRRRRASRMLLAGWLASATLPSAAEESLQVTVDRARPGFEVRATVGVAAPATLCYAVLADFDRLEGFIPDLQASDVVSAPGAPLRLRQVGDAGAGPFHARIDVTLAVTTTPPSRIDFERVAGNLDRMSGSWTVAGSDSRCGIAYRAHIEPRFWIPPLLGPRLMRGQVEAQMQGLLREIQRRAALAQTSSPTVLHASPAAPATDGRPEG